MGDGSTDDTSAISAANAACNSAGGGTVYFPPGTYISGPQTINNNTVYLGAGLGATTIKLKASSNADLWSAFTSSINLTAGGGTGSTTAVNKFSFAEMTLDGNKAGQTGGISYPLRFYGYGFIFQNLAVINGFTGGILYDYSGTMPTNYTLEGTLDTVRIHDNNGIGIETGGPTDTRWNAVLVYNSGSSNIHNTPNSSGLLCVNCHAWSPGLSDSHNASWVIEGTICCTNCEAEGSSNIQLLILRNGVCWNGGRVFAGGAAGCGIQLGQAAGLTPVTGIQNQSGGLTTAVGASYYHIDTEVLLITNTNGGIFFANDSGGTITTTIEGSGTNIPWSGSPHFRSLVNINTIGYTTNNPFVQIPTGLKLQSTSTLFSGTGVPAVGLGANGDFYFRQDTTATPHIYKKISGTWTSIV